MGNRSKRQHEHFGYEDQLVTYEKSPKREAKTMKAARVDTLSFQVFWNCCRIAFVEAL